MTITASYTETYCGVTYFDLRTDKGRIIFKLVECAFDGSHERQLEYICDAMEHMADLDDADWYICRDCGVNVEMVEIADFERVVSMNQPPLEL